MRIEKKALFEQAVCSEEGLPSSDNRRRQLAVTLWWRRARFDLTGCLVVLPDRKQVMGVGGDWKGTGPEGKHLYIVDQE